MTHLNSYLILSFVVFAFLPSLAAKKFEFKHACISSKYHKQTPGREGKEFQESCKPWSNYSCCTTNTSAKIEADGILSLHNMLLDQCPSIKNMSEKCRKHFKHDTCLYECSPNLSPWIVRDTKSKITRRERAMHIPLCSDDCDQWFHDCKDDFTCSGNWGIISDWNWAKRGTPGMCTQQCKTFSQYFKNPKTFCEKIFNYSFKYGSKNRSECMQLWPKSWKDNLKVAELYARRKYISNFALILRPMWSEILILSQLSWFAFLVIV